MSILVAVTNVKFNPEIQDSVIEMAKKDDKLEQMVMKSIPEEATVFRFKGTDTYQVFSSKVRGMFATETVVAIGPHEEMEAKIATAKKDAANHGLRVDEYKILDFDDPTKN